MYLTFLLRNLFRSVHSKHRRHLWKMYHKIYLVTHQRRQRRKILILIAIIWSHSNMACLSIQQIQVTCNLQNLQTRIRFSMKYLLFFQIFERIFPHPVLWLYGSNLQDKHGFPWLTTWWSLIFLLQNLLVWCSR